ncbi:MAG: NAD(P)-dependent oxidoreductase [Planctomycetota bacterium]
MPHALHPVKPETTRVGWIGTGVMGHSMVGHVIDAGYSVDLWTRTSSKADDLIARGANWMSSPQDVAARTDVVFTIVGTPDDVRKVYLGPEGLISHARPNQIFVDMTTSRPSLAVELANAAAAKEAFSIDAPVSGGDTGARAGTLSIMMGGSADAITSIDDLLRRMGETVIHQGGPGMGQHTKMVNQTLIATTMIGICEALLYAERAGLDIEKVLGNVAKGAAGSFALSALAPRMLQGDFEPGFFVEHFIKDMGIALDEAATLKLSLPGLALSRQLYQAVAAQGHGRRGTQALILALAKLNSMTHWNQMSLPSGQV